MKTVAELQADPRTQEAEKWLKDTGITAAWWQGLLVRITALPRRHAEAVRETAPENRKRRAELANKMRKLAVELDNDLNVADFFPAYGGADRKEPVLRIGRPHDRALSIGQWLSEYAEHIEDPSSFIGAFGLLESRRPNTLKSFVIRDVFYLIEHYLAAGRALGIVTAKQPRLIETALLASALLGKKVTENDATQARRKERRRNVRD